MGTHSVRRQVAPCSLHVPNDCAVRAECYHDRVNSGREQGETQRTCAVTPFSQVVAGLYKSVSPKRYAGTSWYGALFLIGMGATCTDRRLLVRDVTWKRISTMHTNATAQTYLPLSRQLRLGTVRRRRHPGREWNRSMARGWYIFQQTIIRASMSWER
jgi:hypothetical protein